MKQEVEYTFVTGRQVPATFHDAIKKTINAVKKGLLHPDCIDEAHNSIFSEKKNEYVDVVSFIGLFLSVDQRDRFDFNEQFTYDSSNSDLRVVRDLLGINKLELKTIMGMKLRHILEINAKYLDFTISFQTHAVGESDNKALKAFKSNFITYLESLLGNDNDYENPGFTAM
jgi:hypothetical protein